MILSIVFFINLILILNTYIILKSFREKTPRGVRLQIFYFLLRKRQGLAARSRAPPDKYARCSPGGAPWYAQLFQGVMIALISILK